MKILVFGRNGWIARQCQNYPGFKRNGARVILTDTDITDGSAVKKVLFENKPDAVLNAAAKTHGPDDLTINWCSQNKANRTATVLSNVVGTEVLCAACRDFKIPFIHLSTAYVFSGHAEPKVFTEDDERIAMPGDHYTSTKILSEVEALSYERSLVLRINLPITFNLNDPRNFLTRLINLRTPADMSASVTILEDLFFSMRKLIERGCTGIYHVVNPDSINFVDIAKCYAYINPSYEFSAISKEELERKNRRGVVLSTEKLKKAGIKLLPAKAQIESFFEMEAARR